MSLDMFKLDGKTALVTGGSKGLGLAKAKARAGAGADIILNSRNQDEADAAANEIAEATGQKAIGMEVDVTNEDQMAGLVEQANSDLGGIDILVNNAGINIRKPTIELSMDEWQEVIDINLSGPFLCTKLVAPGMLEKGWGRVIHIASILGQVGLAGRPAYTATKGALILLTKTQALGGATQGVTGNAICPGPFETPMNKSLVEDPEKYKAFVANIPMGRWGYMNELDGAVVYLASDASSYMTGTTLTIDGGWTAQ